MSRRPSLSADDERLVVELYAPSDAAVPLTLHQVAEKFECSVETIRRTLKKYDVKANHYKRVDFDPGIKVVS